MYRFIVLLVALLFAAAPVFADSETHLVQTEDGTLWVVADSGVRYQITPQQLPGQALSGIMTAAPSDSGLITIPIPAPVAASAPAGQAPITLSGQGTMNTQLFGLAGGNYTIRWSAKNVKDFCYLGMFLRTASGSKTELVVNQAITAGQPTGGETQVYRMPASGDYYIDANATCGWEMSIAPQ